MNENIIIAYQMTVTVLILYFWLNTFLKFHNAMEISTFVFLVIGTLVLAIHIKADHPINALYILGGLSVLFLSIRIYLRLRKFDCYLFFNLFKANRRVIDAYFQTQSETDEIKWTPWLPQFSFPCLFVVQGKQAKELKSFFKKYDRFVKHDLPVRFWNIYLFGVIGLILIAIIWRF